MDAGEYVRWTIFPFGTCISGADSEQSFESSKMVIHITSTTKYSRYDQRLKREKTSLFISCINSFEYFEYTGVFAINFINIIIFLVTNIN